MSDASEQAEERHIIDQQLVQWVRHTQAQWSPGRSNYSDSNQSVNDCLYYYYLNNQTKVAVSVSVSTEAQT